MNRGAVKRRLMTVLVAAGATLGLAAVPAHAGGWADCKSGYVCMWEDGGWQGDEYVHWKPDGVGDKHQIHWFNGDNEITSLYNHSSYAIRVYANDDYSGESICVKPGVDIGTLKDKDFNDDAESVKTVRSC